jgi:hypothetical protein
MEELIVAVLAGLFAGAMVKKLSDKAKNVPVFKDEKISNSNDILNEAHKAQKIGADSASIMLAFSAIESRLRLLTGHDDASYSINNMIDELHERRKINLETVKLIKQLSKIRNETVHSGESKKFSESKVSSYIDKAELVLEKLKQNNCPLDHSDLHSIMAKIDEKQAGEYRHICAGCAFELGKLHKKQKRNSAPKTIKNLDTSQAKPQRHRNAYTAYQSGFDSLN